MHQPGIEPGSVPWQGTILPLDHWCFAIETLFKSITKKKEIILTLHYGL
ncbi:hypothetical protein Pint_10421 [Pistacia integerrima]|uniref:Uncharacterized protein n=1 Tax=Pistacia integerrima TaxID=434235 RepID=A0ACC0XIR2_9ROSI|nr:hypothetical protein Pint_10421 [Pistacia integerrima]